MDEYQPWYDMSSDFFWIALGNKAVKGTQLANAAKLAELYKEQKIATVALETATTAEEIATATETLNFLNETIKGIETAGKVIAVAYTVDDIKDFADVTGAIVGSIRGVSAGSNAVDTVSDIIDTGAKLK